MAALATYLGATEVTELIPTEMLPTFVDEYEYASPAGQAICRARAGKGSIAHRFGRWNQLDAGSGVPAGNKSESDTFTDVLLDTSESSITPGLVGFRMPISDEAVAGVDIASAVPAEAIAEALRGLNDRLDSDILSGITSATNTTGAATDNFTAAKFRSAVSAYRALEIPGSVHAFVGHHDQLRDLLESVGSSSAPWTASTASADLFGAPGGGAFLGSYLGFAMFESGNIPANASNWAGCMTPVGPGSGLGCVMTEMPNVRVTRGDDAENRAVTYAVVRAWYGTGIVNPNRILEVLGRT